MSRIDYKFTLFPQTLSHSPCRVYTYNRLDSIVYPDNTQNNVRYTYGDSTATHNQRGRIALLEDASGFQTFIYGKMGEVTENNRTFVLPNESQPYSFKMKYSYDSWNRVQDITYPDGEVVHYKYNTGGMLRQVQGQRSFFSGLDSVIIGPFDPLNPREDEYDDPTADNAPDFDTTGMGDRATYHNYLYNYITDIRYNEFELKSGQWYGNGTHAHYAYDILQRLSHLTAYNSANNAMQDISYTYDKASNVTQISNAAGVVNTLGDTYSYSYTYDSLYRLTSSYGSIGSGKPLAYYNLNMQYEADGRITYKNQSGRTRLNGTVQTFNDSKSYTYNTSQPHTVQSISGTNYQWDANGNMTNDGGAALTWDEENRLTSHSKSFHRTCFFYDASGERYYKNTGSNMMLVVNGVWQMMTLYTNPTLYTSPYIVATKDGYTKHYYVESERFASRIGDGTITSLNTHATTASALAAKQTQVNDDAPDSVQPNKLSNLLSLPFNWSAHHTTYWQHSDHLGSASWVTDTNGTAYQHLQYMPWGEPLLDQRKSGYTYNSRYTFSGKERDEETGYSYFGARYYNSDISTWLSVDPLADKYPSMSPYTYCADNPVKLVDPDGREIGDPPSHYVFLITEGVEVYLFAKRRGASPKGALLILSQACLESGWGKSAEQDYNLWGLMAEPGEPSKRSTSHGKVKDYSSCGGYEAAFEDYFDRISRLWPDYLDVIKQNDITANDIDNALHTGESYPTEAQRNKGIYAYNADKDANDKNHYGEKLMRQLPSTRRRFEQCLRYKIDCNNQEINNINSNKSFSQEEKSKKIIVIQKQNEKYNTILKEICQ